MVGYQCGAAGLPAAGALCTLRAVQRVAPGKCEATFKRREDRRSPPGPGEGHSFPSGPCPAGGARGGQQRLEPYESST